MHWYFDVFRKYAVFAGRARRSEYWYFSLFNFLVMFVLYLIGAALSGGDRSGPAFIPYFIYVLAALLPSIGVGVRRMHDIGKSGWWLLLALIPFIGGIVILVFACTDSQPGPNEYGPNPKELITAPIV